MAKKRITKADINAAAALIGALGGLAKSKAKIRASRENGKKGGRPKKIKKDADKRAA